MNEQNVGWEYNSDQSSGLSSSSGMDAQSMTEQQSERSVSWMGSEFMDNQKNYVWYSALTLGVLVISLVTYLLSKDIIAVVAIVVIGILFGFIASRKPRQLLFVVDNDGISVGNKFYPYVEFMSFSIQRDGAMNYISMMPLHRLHNELAVYYPPEQEHIVMEIVSSQLPHNQRKENITDKIARLIRF